MKHTKAGISIFCRFSEQRAAETLKPHPRNPYKHSKDQIARLVNVIKKNGWRSPVVVSRQSGVIIKGHARAAAGVELKDTVPVELQDYADADAEHSDLIADNYIAELSEKADQELTGLLSQLQDVTRSGYKESELKRLLRRNEIEQAQKETMFEQAIQLRPAKEYVVIMAETEEEWEQLKQKLKLGTVRRGGYKKGSPYEATGTQRVLTAAKFFEAIC